MVEQVDRLKTLIQQRKRELNRIRSNHLKAKVTKSTLLKELTQEIQQFKEIIEQRKTKLDTILDVSDEEIESVEKMLILTAEEVTSYKKEISIIKEKIGRKIIEKKHLLKEVQEMKLTLVEVKEKRNNFDDFHLKQEKLKEKLKKEIESIEKQFVTTDGLIKQLNDSLRLLIEKEMQKDVVKRKLSLLEKWNQKPPSSSEESWVLEAYNSWTQARLAWNSAKNYKQEKNWNQFLMDAYQSIQNAIDAFIILFQENQEKRTKYEDIHAKINYLYDIQIMIDTRLLSNLSKIHGRLQKGVEVRPQPGFLNEIFDFVQKNMIILRIEQEVKKTQKD